MIDWGVVMKPTILTIWKNIYENLIKNLRKNGMIAFCTQKTIQTWCYFPSHNHIKYYFFPQIY